MLYKLSFPSSNFFQANWSLVPQGGSFQAKIASLKITPYNCSTPLSPTSSLVPVPTTPLESSGAANPSTSAPTQATSALGSPATGTNSPPQTEPTSPSTSTPSTPAGSSASGVQAWTPPGVFILAILVTLVNSP